MTYVLIAVFVALIVAMAFAANACPSSDPICPTARDRGEYRTASLADYIEISDRLGCLEDEIESLKMGITEESEHLLEQMDQLEARLQEQAAEAEDISVFPALKELPDLLARPVTLTGPTTISQLSGIPAQPAGVVNMTEGGQHGRP